MRRFHWFQIVANGILFIFMAIMVCATWFAYSRTSGSTGQDMSQIQKIRYNAALINKTNEMESNKNSPTSL